MLSKKELTDRELLFFSILVSFVVFYVISIILLFTALRISGWETAASGFMALTGPIVMSQLLYRWTVS
jgi:hypothetical protein